MNYTVKTLPDGRFTIDHPYITVPGTWVWDNPEEASNMISILVEDSKAIARADAAWENYEREYGDE